MTVPFGSVPIVRLAAAGLIVRDTGPVFVFAGLLASVAVTVSEVVPAVAGVPLTRQFALSVKPAGSALEVEHV